jgi:hypothetical protein
MKSTVKPIACKFVSALIAAETPVAIVVNVADVGTKYPTTSCPPVNFDERKTNLRVSPVVTVPPTVAVILPETFEPKVTASLPPAEVGLAAPAYQINRSVLNATIRSAYQRGLDGGKSIIKDTQGNRCYHSSQKHQTQRVSV